MTTLSQTGDRDRAYLTVQRDQQRIFRAATRHSRWVRVLRLVIPITVGIACIGTVAVFVLFDPWAELTRAPTATGLVSGSKITMREFRLPGFTKDKRPFAITARTASQDINNPDVVELSEIRAVVSTAAQGDVEVTARSGVFDGKTDKVSLKQNIVVKSPSYLARLSEATIGVKTGHVVSERPVEIEMLEGTVTANRIEIIDSGAVVLFDGGVTMIIDRDQGGSGAKSAGAR